MEHFIDFHNIDFPFVSLSRLQTCPYEGCHRQIVNLSRHMKGVHKVSKHVYELSQALLKDDEGPYKYRLCPFCGDCMQRLDKHLINRHNLGGEENSAKRSKINAEALAVRFCFVVYSYERCSCIAI